VAAEGGPCDAYPDRPACGPATSRRTVPPHNLKSFSIQHAEAAPDTLPWHFRASTSGRYAAPFACGTLPLFVVEALTATMEHTTKTNSTQPRAPKLSRAGVISRFSMLSGTAGLAVGLYEAWLLWTRPRVIPLLVPDVGYVIWFLAPLVDMVFFGLLGLALGWLASRTRSREVPVALAIAFGLTFVVLVRLWFHFEIGLNRFDFNTEVLVPARLFLFAFILSLLPLAVGWPWVERFAEPSFPRLARPLGKGLAAATAIAVGGIGLFLLRPSFSGTAAQAAPPSGAPNIVFITLDTVRADHLSSYGYSRPTTPNIDRFARTGVLFENAISASSWTLASHASMFTGLLPQQHGADWAVPLAQNPWTLAEILRTQGYETASFVANELYLQKGWGTSQGFDNYGDERASLRHNLRETLLGNAVIQPAFEHLVQYDYLDRENAGQLNESVFRWFEHRSTQPYFLFINYFDAHDPYFPPEPYNHRFGGLSSAAAFRLRAFTLTSDETVDFDPQDRDSLIAGYDNCLAYLDRQLAILLGFLRRSSGWQNTVVILTSDHGEAFGWKGSYEHGRNLYRGVLHVPLIIAGPGVPQGLRISHVVGTRQLFSTVLDLAGRDNTPFSRTSLARFWNPVYKPVPSDDAVISELVPTSDPDARHAMASLTTPEWQYIEHRSGRQELYKWKVDPEEQNNLADSPEEQPTLQALRSRLITLVSNATGPWRGPEYLEALDGPLGPPHLSLLQPKPFDPGAPGTSFRIGWAQAFFKPDDSTTIRPTASEQELMRSLPYQ